MAQSSLKLVTAKTAAEVARPLSLGDAARGLLDDASDVRDYLGRLIRSALWKDAVTVLAHALPKRAAVWWACRCARIAAGPAPGSGSPEALALGAAEHWVAEPSEENRRAAGDHARAAGLSTPAGLAAMGAFWGGGSIAPPGLPDVPPGEHFTARAVAGAAMIAGVLAEPENAASRYRRYLEIGLALADGEGVPPNRLDEPEANTPTSPARPASPPQRLAARRSDTWES